VSPSPTRAALAERSALAAAAVLPLGRVAPTPLFDTYSAVMTSRIVIAASRLGVFGALADGAAQPAAVADRLGLDADGADAVLVALAALGYARPGRDGSYALSATARRWLAGNGLTRFVGDFVHETAAHFARLEDVLLGAPPLGLHERGPDDPYWETYQHAMYALAHENAPAVARAIRVRSPRRLLDIGGGPGTYSVAMCRRHPGLEATVVELPPAAEIGRELVALEGCGERVRYRAGDALELDLGSGYDVVTIHNVLHNLPAASCAELVRRARGALRDGGTLAILEIERPPPGRTGTRLAGALGVLFWILQHTRTYTAAEISGWMRAAGCGRVKLKRPLKLPGAVLAIGRT
jgi:2-polyprenyl-3-methyl-5-hydroxy-6-metoxy-1,4-benzoquinol methylase